MENKILYHLSEVQRAERGEIVFPVTCEIDPSNRCMLSCEFCMYAAHLKNHNEDLPLDLYNKLIEELKSLGVKSITFTGGGEPLMNKQFNAMVKLALMEGFELGLITNGVLADRIDDPSVFKFIRVSLDSHDAQTYKKVKGGYYFDRVIDNIRYLIGKAPLVGLSYVVCEDNVHGIDQAATFPDRLGVAYVQFKPAWIGGTTYFYSDPQETEGTIVTHRYVAKNLLPCMIASLIGIVGADSKVYYCCQYRGDVRYELGNLRNVSFRDAWSRRILVSPRISECPQCRYMNYARTYQKIKDQGTAFFDHKNFL